MYDSFYSLYRVISFGGIRNICQKRCKINSPISQKLPHLMTVVRHSNDEMCNIDTTLRYMMLVA